MEAAKSGKIFSSSVCKFRKPVEGFGIFDICFVLEPTVIGRLFGGDSVKSIISAFLPGKENSTSVTYLLAPTKSILPLGIVVPERV